MLGQMGKDLGLFRDTGAELLHMGVDMAKGLGQVVMHPIDTAQGLATVAMNPGMLVDAIKQHGAEYVDHWNKGDVAWLTAHGFGDAFNVVGGVKGLAGIASFASKVRDVGLLATMAETAASVRNGLGKLAERAMELRKLPEFLKSLKPSELLKLSRENPEVLTEDILKDPEIAAKLKKAKEAEAASAEAPGTKVTEETGGSGSGEGGGGSKDGGGSGEGGSGEGGSGEGGSGEGGSGEGGSGDGGGGGDGQKTSPNQEEGGAGGEEKTPETTPDPDVVKQLEELPGHGHEMHGSQVTDQQLIDRVQTGARPDGTVGKKVSAATKFDTPEAELDAVTKGQQLMSNEPPGVINVKPDGVAVPEYKDPIVAGPPEGYGSGYEVMRDANGNPLPGRPVQPTGQLPNAQLVYKWNPGSGTWDPVTQYPTGLPPKAP